jgi:hypothetical protein
MLQAPHSHVVYHLMSQPLMGEARGETTKNQISLCS